MRIKVCGITRLEDARAAVAAGTDAIGFIFQVRSPRYIGPGQARVIIEQLPPFVATVGVFVDKKRSEVEEIIRYCRLGYAQLHGKESPKYCDRLFRSATPCQVIKAFRVGPHSAPADFDPYLPFVQAFLLDTFDPELAGGTGRSFDWSAVARLRLRKPYILAGGLNSTNIDSALEMLAPVGVDVNSGVESSPGIKDARMIGEFVACVRRHGETATVPVSGQ